MLGNVFLTQEFFIVRHYILEVRFLKAKEIIDPSENLRSTGLLKLLLIELLICAVHPYPGLEEKMEIRQ